MADEAERKATKWFSDLVKANGEVARLSSQLAGMRSALLEITEACEADCGGSITDEFGDEESVGQGDESDMALTFGMMRRARAALRAAQGSPTYWVCSRCGTSNDSEHTNDTFACCSQCGLMKPNLGSPTKDDGA